MDLGIRLVYIQSTNKEADSHMTSCIARDIEHKCVDIPYEAYGLKGSQVDVFIKNARKQFGKRRTITKVLVDHTYKVIHMHMDTQGITAIALHKYYEGVCAELVGIMERTIRSLGGMPIKPAVPRVPEQRQSSTPPKPVEYDCRSNTYTVQIGNRDPRLLEINIQRMSKVASVKLDENTLVVTPKRTTPKTEDKKLVSSIVRLVDHVGPANTDQKQVAVAFVSPS